MTSAEIIAIGTELLLGDNVDTNTAHIARQLRDYGIELFRTAIVGDNKQRIAAMIRESLERAEIVITTGGLGPTVDDPTRAAVALAFERDLEFKDHLWEDIQARFALLNRPATENNRIQASIPKGAVAVRNPVGTAPAFIVVQEERMVASLPGVPGEMEIILEESILPFILNKYQIRSVIKSTVLHCAGVGESIVDDLIADLEKCANPTVGLLAHPGLVDIRITARADDAEGAMKMIEPVREVLKIRLADHLFGEDAESLSGVVADKLKRLGHNLPIFVQGIDATTLAKLFPPELQSLLEITHIDIYDRVVGDRVANIPDKWDQISTRLEIRFFEEESRSGMTLSWNESNFQKQVSRFFAGPPGSLFSWRSNLILDFIRRNLG